jgi:hypothetical protein
LFVRILDRERNCDRSVEQVSSMKADRLRIILQLKVSDQAISRAVLDGMKGRVYARAGISR